MRKRLHGRILVCPLGAFHAEIAPDNAHLLISSVERVRFWNYHSARGKDLDVPSRGGVVPAAALSPDGKSAIVVTAVPTCITLFDIDTGEALWSELVTPSPTLKSWGWGDGRADRVRIGANAWCAMISCNWGETFIWNLAERREIRRLRGRGRAIDANGERVVSSSAAHGWDGNAGAYTQPIPNSPCVWSVESGDKLVSLTGHKAGVTDAAFSPCGRFILTGSLDSTVRLWDGATGGELCNLPSPGPVQKVAFSPVRDVIAFSSGRAVHLWDVAARSHQVSLDAHGDKITSISLSKDGNTLVTASLDGTVCRWAAREDISDSEW